MRAWRAFKRKEKKKLDFINTKNAVTMMPRKLQDKNTERRHFSTRALISRALRCPLLCFQIFYAFLSPILSLLFSYLKMYKLAYLLYTYNYHRCLLPLLLLLFLPLLLSLRPPVHSSSSLSSSSSSPPVNPDFRPFLGVGRFLFAVAV